MNDPFRKTASNCSAIENDLRALCAEATKKSEPGSLIDGAGSRLQAFQKAGPAIRHEALGKLSTIEKKLVYRQERLLKQKKDLSLLEQQNHSGRFAKEDHPGHASFYELVKAELALTSHIDFQKVFLLGTEPYPLTAMLYSELTGKPVVCYEPEEHISKPAQGAVAMSKWRDRIHIRNETFDIAATRSGGLIVINTDVPSKRSVLKNIRKHGDDACPILCRTRDMFEPILHKALNTKSLPGFFPIRSMQTAYSDLMDVFLLSSRKDVTEALTYRWPDHLCDEDKEKILTSMNAIIPKDPGIGYPFPLNEEEGKAFTDALDHNIRSGKKRLLLVEYQNELAAQAILTPNASFNNKHLAEISRAFVMEPFRGIGLELLALKKIVARAKGLDIKTLVLDARGGTNAPQRWKTIGFQVYGILPDYSFVRGRYYDGVYMYQTIEDFEAKFGPCLSQ